MMVAEDEKTTPRPDPTELTTEQLKREISRVESIISLKIASLTEQLIAETNLTKERFIANGKAQEALRTFIDEKVEAAADAQSCIREVFDEKFSGITEEHGALKEMLNERYATQTKALDAAFLAQQAAVATAFATSEKAMAAALLAAKEAVEKANVATEKRFDSLQSLLSQQNSTLSLLLPRAEAEVRMSGLDNRLTDMKSALDRGFSAVDTKAATGKDNWGYLVGALGLALTAVIIVMNVIATR